jgi:hypothetical protein
MQIYRALSFGRPQEDFLKPPVAASSVWGFDVFISPAEAHYRLVPDGNLIDLHLLMKRRAGGGELISQKSPTSALTFCGHKEYSEIISVDLCHLATNCRFAFWLLT